MKKIEGIKSNCCDEDVHKYYNSRNPGYEEEFICNSCDKDNGFYETKKILDPCCGPRGFWFDKENSSVLYIDNRNEVHKDYYPSGYKRTAIEPDLIGDFTDIKQPDNTFYLVIFDPPHIKRDEANKGQIGKRYGKLSGNWEDMIKRGFSECFRVLKPYGVLIFKWNEVEIPLKDILKLTDEEPLFGHKTKKNLKTHWVTFMKFPKEEYLEDAIECLMGEDCKCEDCEKEQVKMD